MIECPIPLTSLHESQLPLPSHSASPSLNKPLPRCTPKSPTAEDQTMNLSDSKTDSDEGNRIHHPPQSVRDQDEENRSKLR